MGLHANSEPSGNHVLPWPILYHREGELGGGLTHCPSFRVSLLMHEFPVARVTSVCELPTVRLVLGSLLKQVPCCCSL